MPSKSSSPHAAQKRVWKAEITGLDKSRRKISRDFDAEYRRLSKIANDACRALNRFIVRRQKLQPRAVADIDRRIAFLQGRLGI